MTINVTQEDIDFKREFCNGCNCPVALAIYRATGCWIVLVERSEAHIYQVKGQRHKEVPLPKKASEWIRRFDSGVAVKPFTFELAI